MTSDALLILNTIFSTCWRLLTSWYIPGTHTTPAAWFLFLGVTGIVLRLIMRITISYQHKEDNFYSDDNYGG